MRRRRKPREKPKRRWRDYQTEAGGRPVKNFISGLAESDRTAIYAAMNEVRRDGLGAADFLEDEIYEVKANGAQESWRLLFAPEGEHDQVLLSLHVFSKKTQQTPRRHIDLAKRRLRDWRSRGRKT